MKAQEARELAIKAYGGTLYLNNILFTIGERAREGQMSALFSEDSFGENYPTRGETEKRLRELGYEIALCSDIRSYIGYIVSWEGSLR